MSGRVAKTRSRKRDFETLQPLKDITGPWSVTFADVPGSPGKLAFETLDDWAMRPEDEVRHYSGSATYATTWNLGKRKPLKGKKAFISLGKVHELARVRLNGRDLGIVWCPPWRVEIPDGVLEDRGNQLEIEVANLWSNRLIGDQRLPPERRSTWATWHGYTETSPLQPSGLLGPVRLSSEVGPKTP
jgi:hypothetical protein